MQKKNGFTLVELLIVIIIIGILAAVAIPIMRNFTKRAIMTEGIAALGTIRTAERAYFNEHGTYCIVGGNILNLPGIADGDLNGTYFIQEAYMVLSPTDESEFWALCLIGDGYLNPSKKDYVLRVMGMLNDFGWICMDQDGNITTLNIPNSGYPEWSP